MWQTSGTLWPRHSWYVACRSDDLKQAPLARTLLGTPLVLFRDGGGRPAAVLDRCPHRNAPLSAGRVVQGRLQCGYHGWEFDSEGICRRIPGLCAPVHEGKARRVPAYLVREQQGFVWVYAGAENGDTAAANNTTGGDSAPGAHRPPLLAPYVFPHVDDAAYTSVRYDQRFEAGLFATAENILDVPHTAFLHRGLFRSAPSDSDSDSDAASAADATPVPQPNRIRVALRRSERHVEAEYIGEPRPKGVLGAVLAPRGGTILHVDRFVLPCIAQVEYALGKSHLVITNALTPIAEYETHVHTVVSLRLGLASSLVRHMVTPLALRVAAQDARMLRLQSRNIQRFGGERFVSTEIDILGPHILRLLKRAAQGEVDARDSAGDADTAGSANRAEARLVKMVEMEI